jgi:hypothetical protein
MKYSVFYVTLLYVGSCVSAVPNSDKRFQRGLTSVVSLLNFSLPVFKENKESSQPLGCVSLSQGLP